MRTQIRTAMLVALALAACGGGVAQGAGPVENGVARFHRYSQGWDPNVAAPARTASRFRVVILQGAFTADMQRLKRANPDLRVLLYKNMSQTIQASGPAADRLSSTVVDYAAARQSHPEWFLRDPSGALVTRSYAPGETDYLMDVGSASYADAAASSVLAQARRDGWDGVFLDDALPTVRYWVRGGSPGEVARYPTDSAWSAATRRFLAVVGSRLRAAHMTVIANTCCNVTYGAARRLGEPARRHDGRGLREPDQRPHVAARVHLGDELERLARLPGRGGVRRAEQASCCSRTSAGLAAIGRVRGTDSRRSCWRPARNLVRVSRLRYRGDVVPHFTTALSLGRPLERYRVIAPGVYRRRFLHGIVLVNASRPGSPAQVVPLDGVYSGSGLRNVRSVVLGPVEGLVLAR